jgi:pimeloyl-ACP methyl ester carboxylesterase
MPGRAVVLIPGAGGSAWTWHRVTAELGRRGYDVVAVDLPGDDDAASLPEYADAVIAAVGDREDLVIVGHPLGAFTAVGVCDRLPVSLLVLVNAMIPNPGETPGEWWDNTGQPHARAAMDIREGRDPEAEFDVTTYFLHDVPAEVLAGAEPPPEQSGTPFSTPLAIEHWPDVETRVVVSRDERFFPAQFQRQVAQERLGIVADEVPGGHLVALSQPIELTDLLESYLAQ